MAAEVSSSRRRVRAGMLAAVLVLAAGGSVAVARGGLLGRSAAAPATSGVSTGTATVSRTDVVERVQVAGTLGYDGSYTVVGLLAGGIVTWAPAPGTVVRRGQPLYRADGQPVRLLYGNQAAWRAFGAGMPDGPDVRQLEDNLTALGFDPDHAMTVDDHFSPATRAAVRRWQAGALGLPPARRTGTVPLGQVAFLPGPIRVTAVTATLGGPVQAGAAILSATSTRPAATVALPPALQQSVRRGDRVLVTLPNGATVPGTVTTVGRVAVQPGPGAGGQGQGQGGNDSGGSGGSGGGGQATIPLTVALATPRTAGDLDQAPVQVAITTQTHRRVLTVPISALLAHPGGGYDVEVVSGGAHRRLPVRTGLFDETTGLVEVAGAGLAEETRVEVPAP
jgi:peptidoglycan hydrolase-like protein with peptidoglycan-binding domain